MLNTTIEKGVLESLIFIQQVKICQSRHNLSQWLYYNKGNNPKLYLLSIGVLSNLLSELNKYSFYPKNSYFFQRNSFRFTAHATRATPLLQNLFAL